MNRRETVALDDFLTGHYGEDQFDNDATEDDTDDEAQVAFDAECDEMARQAEAQAERPNVQPDMQTWAEADFVPAPVSWAVQRKIEQLRQREQHGPA